MSVTTIDKIHAMCGVIGNASGSVINFAFNTGVNAAASTHPSAGKYVFVLDDPLAQRGASFSATAIIPESDVISGFQTIDVSISADGTTITCIVYNVDTPTDIANSGFTLIAFRAPYANGF